MESILGLLTSLKARDTHRQTFNLSESRKSLENETNMAHQGLTDRQTDRQTSDPAKQTREGFHIYTDFEQTEESGTCLDSKDSGGWGGGVGGRGVPTTHGS